MHFNTAILVLNLCDSVVGEGKNLIELLGGHHSTIKTGKSLNNTLVHVDSVSEHICTRYLHHNPCGYRGRFFGARESKFTHSKTQEFLCFRQLRTLHLPHPILCLTNCCNFNQWNTL